ncbi:MAG: flippase-like domain-containing protein [Ignavibacteriales bacterium]|nr:flippase-like domain-containing protein [Ignavibacteriales bacterium]
MPRRIKKILQALISFLVAGVFLYLAFKDTKFSDLWESLTQVQYVWVVLLVPVGLLSHYVRGVRWSYLLRPVKRGISHRNLFSAVMIGQMMNNVLPRLGELVRCYGLGRSERMAITSVLGTVVVERILDLLIFALMICGVVYFYPAVLLPFVENTDVVRPLLLFGSIASFLVLILLFFKGETIFMILKFVQPIVPRGFREKYERSIEGFLSGFKIARMSDTFLPILLLSFFMWFMYAVSLYMAFLAFRDPILLNLGFDAAIILLTASTIAFILPAPGAMGTYHSFLTVALVQLYGVDSVMALSYSVVTHEVGYIVTTAVGLYYFLKDHLHISEAEQAAQQSAKP